MRSSGSGDRGATGRRTFAFSTATMLRAAGPFHVKSGTIFRSISTSSCVDVVTRALAQVGRRAQRPARREHVVDQQRATVAGLHLEHAAAVLQRVRERDHRRRQLALLADQRERLAVALGQRRAEDEAARLDPDTTSISCHSAATPVAERGDRRDRMAPQQRRDVAKQDARLREVGDGDDMRGEVGQVGTQKEGRKGRSRDNSRHRVTRLVRFRTLGDGGMTAIHISFVISVGPAAANLRTLADWTDERGRNRCREDRGTGGRIRRGDAYRSCSFPSGGRIEPGELAWR